MDSVSVQARITQEEQLLADTQIECSRAEWELSSLVDYSDYHSRVTAVMKDDLLQRRDRLKSEGDGSGSRILTALIAGLNTTIQQGEALLAAREEQAQRIRGVIGQCQENVTRLKDQERETEESLVASYSELAIAHEEEAME